MDFHYFHFRFKNSNRTCGRIGLSVAGRNSLQRRYFCMDFICYIYNSGCNVFCSDRIVFSIDNHFRCNIKLDCCQRCFEL